MKHKSPLTTAYDCIGPYSQRYNFAVTIISRFFRFDRRKYDVRIRRTPQFFFFLPTAIILQSVGRDVPSFGQRVSRYPIPNLRPRFKNKVIYRREKKNRMVERYHRVCTCACINGRYSGSGPTFVTLSEYGIFCGTMARKPYVGHWMEYPAYSARCIGSTIGTSGRRKMNR